MWNCEEIIYSYSEKLLQKYKNWIKNWIVLRDSVDHEMITEEWKWPEYNLIIMRIYEHT